LYIKANWGKYWEKVGKTINKGDRMIRSPLFYFCPAVWQRAKKIATKENRVARCLIGCVAICLLWLAGRGVRDGGMKGLQAVEVFSGGLLGAEELLHDFGGSQIALAEGVSVFAQGGFGIAVAKAGSDGDSIHIVSQQDT
jgi:hypothetical protein